MATANVDLLDDDYKAPQRPRWASPSPDGKTIVFARNHNLFMMDADSYALAQKKADDPAIKETQLTKDGEEHYSYARSAQQLQQEQEQLQQQQQQQDEQQQTTAETEQDRRTRTRACRRCRSSGRRTRRSSRSSAATSARSPTSG